MSEGSKRPSPASGLSNNGKSKAMKVATVTPKKEKPGDFKNLSEDIQHLYEEVKQLDESTMKYLAPEYFMVGEKRRVEIEQSLGLIFNLQKEIRLTFQRLSILEASEQAKVKNSTISKRISVDKIRYQNDNSFLTEITGKLRINLQEQMKFLHGHYCIIFNVKPLEEDEEDE